MIIHYKPSMERLSSSSAGKSQPWRSQAPHRHRSRGGPRGGGSPDPAGPRIKDQQLTLWSNSIIMGLVNLLILSELSFPLSLSLSLSLSLPWYITPVKQPLVLPGGLDPWKIRINQGPKCGGTTSRPLRSLVATGVSWVDLWRAHY